jgi:predicted nuclease of predicted toxin-antitoxin system
MKVLLDENLPHELRLLLMPMHEVFTVSFLSWSALENGNLLLQAASNGFEAMVTKGQGIEHEQNLGSLPLSVIVLRAKTNKIDDIRPLVPELLSALASLKACTLVRIPSN